MEAVSGAARRLLLLAKDDPLWKGIPIEEGRELGAAARRLLTRPAPPLEALAVRHRHLRPAGPPLAGQDAADVDAEP